MNKIVPTALSSTSSFAVSSGDDTYIRKNLYREYYWGTPYSIAPERGNAGLLVETVKKRRLRKPNLRGTKSSRINNICLLDRHLGCIGSRGCSGRAQQAHAKTSLSSCATECRHLQKPGSGTLLPLNMMQCAAVKRDAPEPSAMYGPIAPNKERRSFFKLQQALGAASLCKERRQR